MTKDRDFSGPTNWLRNPAQRSNEPKILTATFTKKGHQPCELWKHTIMGVVYAIAPGYCPPINSEFISTSTVTI